MRIYRLFRNVKLSIAFVLAVAAAVKVSKYFPAVKGEYLPVITEKLHSSKKEEMQTTAPKRTPQNVRWMRTMAPEDRLDRPEQMLYRMNYAVSYNCQTLNPNWVLWRLTREQADGAVKRPDYAFHEDPEVPVPRATLEDYRGSNYDRGHMCPAGDNKWDSDAMYESFLMTNICPQNQQMNSGLWNQIEMSCRYWAKKYGCLYIVCGPIFLRGQHQSIGHNGVLVPEAFFKVVLCLEGEPKGIGFICRNTDGNRKKDYYVNTITQIERITGYTFFPDLEQKISVQVKDHADIEEW